MGGWCRKAFLKEKQQGTQDKGPAHGIRRKFVEKGHELNMLNVRFIRQQNKAESRRYLAMSI